MWLGHRQEGDVFAMPLRYGSHKELRMHKMKEQFGGALLTVLLCIVFVGSIGFLGVKLAPVYLEHFGVISSLASMEKERSLHGKSPLELRQILGKRLQINDVHRVSEADAEIDTKPRQTTIRLAYEVQVPLLSNVNLLVMFDDHAELR
jgi:hypothetical protein